MSEQQPFEQSESSSELATDSASNCAAKRCTEWTPDCSAEHAAVLVPVCPTVGISNAAAVPAAVSTTHFVSCRSSHEPPQRSAVATAVHQSDDADEPAKHSAKLDAQHATKHAAKDTADNGPNATAEFSAEHAAELAAKQAAQCTTQHTADWKAKFPAKQTADLTSKQAAGYAAEHTTEHAAEHATERAAENASKLAAKFHTHKPDDTTQRTAICNTICAANSLPILGIADGSFVQRNAGHRRRVCTGRRRGPSGDTSDSRHDRRDC